MTKPAEFFLEKANEHKKAFTYIIEHYEPNTLGGWDPNPKYKEQQELLELRILETTLLFAEFDKGVFFLDEIKKIPTRRLMAYQEKEAIERIQSYVKVIDIFINHLNTFRL